MTYTVADLPDLRLIRAEESLHEVFALRKAAGADVTDVLAAHKALTTEMTSRGLLFEPLDKATAGTTTGTAANRAPAQRDNLGDSRPPSYTHPDDDPMRQGGKKAKRNKSPDTDRTQDATGGATHSGGDPNNPGDLGYITTRGLHVGERGGEANRTQDTLSKPGLLPANLHDDGTPDYIRPIGKAFRSKAQARWAFGGGLSPDQAREWAKKTDFSKIPDQLPEDSNLHKAASGGPHLYSANGDGACGKCHLPLGDHLSKAATPSDIAQPFDDETRREMSRNGIARPDGSFPIPDEAHLHAAIRLVDRARDPQAAMAHIITRAKAMGLTHALPAAWVQNLDTTDQNGSPQPRSTTKPDDTQSDATPVPDMTKDFNGFTEPEAIVLDPDMAYAVVKSSNENRYTLGPLYMPSKLDAHDEWASAEHLFKSCIDYVRRTGADRTVYLQHSPYAAGEWVSIVQWPHEVHATMVKSVDGMQKAESVTFPAGTVYMGVVWKDWAWDAVKKGKIGGLSMGGWAQRVEGSP
jgi:hypothetical protein